LKHPCSPARVALWSRRPRRRRHLLARHGAARRPRTL